jgi:outer membrane protein assembly factor BamA
VSRSLPALAALALLLWSVLPSGAARADEAERYKGWQVRSFALEGLEPARAAEISKGLALAGRRKLVGREYPRFYPLLVEEDTARIRLFLARRGYPDATVTPRFEPGSDDRGLGVVLVVDEGAPTWISRLEVRGLPDEVPAGSVAGDLPSEGDIYSDPSLTRSIGVLENAMRDRGYANATVRPTVAPATHGTVAVRLDAEPGPLYSFGDLVVSGVPDDLERLVRATNRIRPGDRYSPEAVASTRLALRQLDLFRQVRLHTEPDGGDTLDVHADFVLLSLRSLEFGVGYLTDEQLWGRGRWKHRNLFRRGRGFELQASASRHLLGAHASTWVPALITGHMRGALQLSAEEEREEAYRSTTYEIEPSLRAPWGEHGTWNVALAFSNVRLTVLTDDPTAFQEEGGVLTVLGAGLDRDTSNDPISPERGSVTSVHANVTPVPALTRAEFASVELRHVAYRRLAPGFVLAGRAAFGIAAPYGGSPDLLPRYRFFSGGASSQRGFRRRHLGPLDTNGDPVGGEAKVEGSVELRFPLFGRVHGATFVDVGQVYERHGGIDLGRLETAVGPALMVRTPVGPVRGDVGFRLGESHDYVFHLSIGNPY